MAALRIPEGRTLRTHWAHAHYVPSRVLRIMGHLTKGCSSWCGLRRDARVQHLSHRRLQHQVRKNRRILLWSGGCRQCLGSAEAHSSGSWVVVGRLGDTERSQSVHMRLHQSLLLRCYGGIAPARLPL